ncbi:MAG TPA: alpha/beta fold hydrolase [Gaiellaceae bacterium]
MGRSPSGLIHFEGQRLRYVDEGEGPPVLLIHGEPTSSYLWRNLIPPLVASGYRTVAPDLIGFGGSDKPEDVGWYSYDRHVASIAQLVDELGLRGITLVVHDWGGPIGLRFAVEHEELVDRLVVLDTGIGGGRPPSELWLRFREVVRSAGADVDPARLVESGTVGGLTDEARAAYAAPFPTPGSKAGVRAFPELVPAEPDHPNTEPMNRVRESLRSWTKPTLVVWGSEDAALPAALAHVFSELIPGAGEPVVLEGAGHFLQEDRPDELAAAILGFLT